MGGQVFNLDLEALGVDDAGEFARELHDVYAGCAAAKQDGQKLAVAQRGGAFAKEFFARPVLFRYVADALVHGFMLPNGSG